MNEFVRKEVRQLLPWFGIALLLACSNLLLLKDTKGEVNTFLYILPFVLCPAACVLLALHSFGREFSTKTFTHLLAQPISRGRIWWTKSLLLLLAFGVITVTWWITFRIGALGTLSPGAGAPRTLAPQDVHECSIVAGLFALAVYSGGLWTTLLFRQVIAAFWLTLLCPTAILMALVNLLGDKLPALGWRVIVTALVVYSCAAFLLAWRLFLRAQDIQWTGGTIALPLWLQWPRWLVRRKAQQTGSPLVALLGKELQLQQMNLMIAGLLLLVQVGVLLLPRSVNPSEHYVIDMLVQHFWVVWIVMPLLVGCSAVAEERRLGTLEPQLCLPVSCAWQFAVKVFVTMVCSIVLGALVPVAVAAIHPAQGLAGMEFYVTWTLACVCLVLVSTYASSLTQQLLQAVGATIGIIVVWLFLGSWFTGSFSPGSGCFSLFGSDLWRGPLVLIVGAGVTLLFTLVLTWRRGQRKWLNFLTLIAVALIVGKISALLAAALSNDSHAPEIHSSAMASLMAALLTVALCPVLLMLTLAAKNFKHTQTSLSLWRRNSAAWLGCLVLTGVITALVYNRAWELAMPFEPSAGVPHLSGPVQPVIAGSWVERPTLVLLPDGRLCSYTGYERIPWPITLATSNKAAASGYNLRRLKNPRVEFVGGSNWAAIALTSREFMGVKSDGSFWIAPCFEQVDQAGNIFPFRTGSSPRMGMERRPIEPKFERLGAESDWAAVAASRSHCVALKRDGTIWGWGDNNNKQLGADPASITNSMVQIGGASNWVAVYAGRGRSYAVNRDGELWNWGKFRTDSANNKTTDGGPAKINLKAPGIRDIIAGNYDYDVILDTNGNLWGLGIIPNAWLGEGERQHNLPRSDYQYHGEPIRLLGSNWSSVSCGEMGLAGLKTDGTLWVKRPMDPFRRVQQELAQQGKRTDWIAVQSLWEADVALAKDGTLCRFGDLLPNRDIELLAPTRRVTWSLNLLDAAK